MQLRQLWGRQATSQPLSLRLLLGSGAAPAGPRPELTALADKGLLHSLQAVNDTDIHFQPEQSQLVARDSQGGWLAMQGSLLLRLEKARDGSLQPAQAIDLSALRDAAGQPFFTLDQADTQPLVLSSGDGQLILIGMADRQTGALGQDLLLIQLPGMQAYSLPGTRGASYFDISPGGGRLIYETEQGMQALDLNTQTLIPLGEVSGPFGFTQQDELIIGLAEGQALVLSPDGQTRQVAFEGLLNAGQPGHQQHELILLLDGQTYPFSLNASVSLDAAARQIRLQAEGGEEQLIKIPR